MKFAICCDGLPDARRRSGASKRRHGGQEPFVPVAVTYRERAAPATARARRPISRRFGALGFNSVRVPWRGRPASQRAASITSRRWIGRWSSPARRGWRSVRLDTASLPDWLLAPLSGRTVRPRVKATGAAQPDRACLDHPGVRADVEAYVAAAAANAARHSAWHAIDLGSDLPDGFCLLSAHRAPLSRVADGGVRIRAATALVCRVGSCRVRRAPASGPSRASHRRGIGPSGAHSASSSARAPSILRTSARRAARSGRLAHVDRRRPLRHGGASRDSAARHYCGLRDCPRATGAGARRSALGDARQGMADDRRRARGSCGAIFGS